MALVGMPRARPDDVTLLKPTIRVASLEETTSTEEEE
jgi:hypothetical protein